MKYSEKTLQYYDNLNNIGGFDENIDNIGTGIVGSPLCGDVMKLQLFFDENDVISDAKYKVFGCVSAIAAMEYVTTILKGKSIDEAKKIENKEVADSLELTTIKRHCSVLASEAIESAINNYLSKKNKEGLKMITVSETALLKLRELVLANGEACKGVEINVALRGCAGVEYSLAYKIGDDDSSKSKIELNGVAFYYEPKFEMMIKGVDIDIVENSFGTGFVVVNKNQISCYNCTCGKSNQC